MFDRGAIEEFLVSQFEDLEWDLPEGDEKQALVEEFCQYVERDFYEWLKDNFRSFFRRNAVWKVDD